MTFQRSLFISVGIHTLIFGSAFAFAHQYGYMLGRSDTITVMLVGSGSSSEKGLRNTIADSDLEPRRQRESARHNEAFRMDDAEGARIVPATTSESTPESQTAARSTNGMAKNFSGNKKSGGETGRQFGIITPDQWRIIESALERVKSYPRIARERGIEGVVHVRFKVLPSGIVERVEIMKSSGSEVLDSASVKTVYRSGPLPSVNGWIEVPITYVLK